MTEQKPNTPAEEREPTPEEIAILEEGKRQVERAKMAIGQPIPLMTDPMWLLSDEGRGVLQHALGRGVNNQPVPIREGSATVHIPHDFSYNATHHHRFLFREGVREMPLALLDIRYIRDHGVKIWNRPPVQTQTILGSSTLGPTVRVGSADRPAGPFITQAFQESGMSVEDWNSLSDEERGTRAIDCASKASAAQEAARAESGGAVPGGGVATVQPQPKPRDQQPPPNKIAPGPPKK